MKKQTIHVKNYIGIDGLREIEHAWRQLAVACGTTFVHYPIWHRAYLLALNGDRHEVIFFCGFCGDMLVAVLPLRTARKALNESFRIPFRYRAMELSYPDEMGYCDMLLHPEFTSAELLATLTAAVRRQKGWDALECLYHPQGSRFGQMVSSDRSYFTKLSHVSRYLDIAAGYEAFMGQYSKKFRKNLQRKLNNLQKLGAITFAYNTTEAELRVAFANFLKVESSGWKGKDGTSIIKQPDRLSYYRHLLEGFGETGQLVIHLLWLGDRCIGGQFAVQCKTTLYLLKIGYDETYAPVSPGFLLLDQLLKTACQRGGIGRISFVTGRDWMDVWKPLEEEMYNSYYFNTTPRGIAPGFMMRLYERLKPTIKFLAARGATRHPD